MNEIDIVRNQNEFQALRAEWTALWNDVSGTHGESFIACWLVWNCILRQTGSSLCIVTARRQRRLIAVWPLVRMRNRLWTVLRPLSPESADYTTLLCDPAHASVQLMQSMWRTACEKSGVDIVTLPYVAQDSALYQVAMSHEGLIAATQAPYTIARLSCEKDWAQFAGSLGTLSGKKPGALRRRLERQGTVAIRVLGPDDADENARIIDWMLACKRDWAERVDKKGQWLYSMPYRDFLVALANHRDSEGDNACARVMIVELNGVPVAANMVGLGKASVIGAIAGFDRQYAKFAPGSIATEEWVRWALENRRDFDLGIGSESFKAYWSKGNTGVACSFQIAQSRWGRVAFAMRRAATKISAARAETQRGQEVATSAETGSSG
ncbi:GNAT family N-acetyltransferase [Caballeronia sp. Lep1P3]|uniref:GNAT family N-acetyltransferase n=1 Tax=Caballeronia sp. Lep1P3 TaxID=2878150 RepID=UPI001FD29BD2|nr:GNAT family N-acetyltransferase [Caballeronia sp. Lep1P3]